MTNPDETSQHEITAKVNTPEVISSWEEKAERAKSILTKISFGAHTDIGRIRENNEDKFEFLLPEDTDELALKGVLFAVADGMGGHAAGQIASELALKTIVENYYSDTSPLIEESLRAALKAANGIVYDVSRAIQQRQGMGTTATVLVIRGDEAYLAQVGDSRCYRVRNNNIEQISDDHTWVNDQVKMGSMSREEAENSPFSNLITRSIGNSPGVEVDVFSLDLQEGDLFVLCSDGLSGELSDGQILENSLGGSASQAAWELVKAAVEKGGRDNTTAVVVSVREITVDSAEQTPKKKSFISSIFGS